MALLKISIKSNHEDGESYENTINIELCDELLGNFMNASKIDWAKLNSFVVNISDYKTKVKEEMLKHKIEVPDQNYWTTTAILTALNNQKIPEDFDFFEIEDKLMTGDFLYD
jgi:hypothetical protein